ncbi:uncharacterized protein Bfra_009254 [Botrytis fragariae]|uniref:Protein kinase domain-containing protein n=1 Tax=Botrytis fragariae TaxID=1964551 RepID=A0A8H6EG61_9HELO|nr:uncharacterized protein Bfra_009254 [Botrytis fragariae]KAF5870705.1 hypothetical protein Bfra_009254 [Botrytis fragariae]
MNIDPAMEEAERYLKQSEGWAPVHIGKDWVAVKRLGGGSYGIATLFEYRGHNPDVSPRQLVVKQEGGAGLNLKQESRVIQSLMKYDSDHIIKIYKAYHRTMGTGTNDAMDRAIVDYANWLDTDKKRDANIKVQLRRKYDVARIYLEFASGGDLGSWMFENCQDQRPPEEYIFRIWECLLKALMVLKYGTENPNDSIFEKEPKDRLHQPIAHFDIKGPNKDRMLNVSSCRIGDNPRPGHERISVHKLADFGLALEVPDAEVLKRSAAKRREWLKIAQGRNTYYAPEQFLVGNPNRVIGTSTDVWNVANVIYQCLVNNNAVPDNEFFETGVDPEPSETFLTMGKYLLHPELEVYSRRFRGLILKSLAYYPGERPDVRDLLVQVQESVDFWNFGEIHDLFLEGIYGGEDGWDEKYPDATRRSKKYQGMQMIRLQKERQPRNPDYSNPKWWKPAEDEYDYDDYDLLFPTRKALQMGYREMPFELGKPIRNPMFPDWRAVGPDGRPVRGPTEPDFDDPEDDPEDDADDPEDGAADPEDDPEDPEYVPKGGDQRAYNKGKRKGGEEPIFVRALAIERGVKRMRTPEEQEAVPWIKPPPPVKIALKRRARRAKRRKPQRRIVQPKRKQELRVAPYRDAKRQRIADPNSPQFYGKEYKMNTAGKLMVRRAGPLPRTGEIEVERSTPWALNQPSPRKPVRGERDNYDNWYNEA